MSVKTKEREEALEQLREMLKPGDTVYTVLRHVSQSGMTRWIDCYIIRDNEPVWISWKVGAVVGSPVNMTKHDGVQREGCGMDMGFDLVYSLSRHLFEGWICRERHGTDAPAANCPLCEGDGRTMKLTDPGYALRQRWM